MTTRRKEKATKTEPPHVRLQRFADDMGLSSRRLAERLQITHPTVLRVVDEKNPEPPTENVRKAVEVLTAAWTEGPIRESEWPKTKYEIERAEKLAKVRPFIPPSPKAA